MRVLIINGPNLNLLGTREPDIYGDQTLDEVIAELRLSYPAHQMDHHQTNHEGFIIDLLHTASDYAGVILNPGAYTHTSIAIRDAIVAITTPVVEVHISNILEREDFRQKSYLTEVVTHAIMGKGVAGYNLAMDYLLRIGS